MALRKVKLSSSSPHKQMGRLGQESPKFFLFIIYDFFIVDGLHAFLILEFRR